MKICSRRGVRWFLVGGGVGVCVAILLLVIRPANPLITLFLWPTSIVGLADPQTLADKLLLGSFMFGGNFLLYGIFAGVAGFAAGESQH